MAYSTEIDEVVSEGGSLYNWGWHPKHVVVHNYRRENSESPEKVPWLSGDQTRERRGRDSPQHKLLVLYFQSLMR